MRLTSAANHAAHLGGPGSPAAAGVAAAHVVPDTTVRVDVEALLAGLNGPQREVATRRFGPLLVVAGPGAGKTRGIAARVAHLVHARGVPPRQIVAITFSRRAAAELQERLAAVLGPAAARSTRPPDDSTSTPSADPTEPVVWAGTFHALGARILRHGGAQLFGRPRNFTIYDQDDVERTLRRILGTLGVPAKQLGRLTTAARQAISLAKRRGGAVAPDARVEEGDDDTPPLHDVLSLYQAELDEAGAFDFDDLVCVTAEALDRDAELRAWAQRRARHLLVDEYQDTDPAQEALLRRLSPPPHDVCVVADPQQSIYAFRGAAPEQVQRFLEGWPNAGIIRLEQNYRSSKSIVAIARRLVAPYATGGLGAVLRLRLWTENPPGRPARLWVAPHPEREGDAIARDIAAKLEAEWPPEEIAILVRTHAQARPIEAALLRAKVPYVLVGGTRFFAREEIKDALAYLRLAALQQDAASFWRVINTPRRGLGPAALMTIARHTLAGGGPVAGARRWAATEQAPDGLYDFLAHADELTALERSGAGPAAVLSAALRLTGYREYVWRQHPDDAPARLDALRELVQIAEAYDDTRRFLDDAALAAAEDDLVPSSRQLQGRVRLSTVHAAKGLEFRAVYVPGCEYGLFPLTRGRQESAEAPADGDDGGDESKAIDGKEGEGAGAPPPSALVADPEERRVFYVAITRAKQELTLSYCTFRRDGRTSPSPFLKEIGRGLLRRAKLGTDEPAPVRRRAPRPRPLTRDPLQ